MKINYKIILVVFQLFYFQVLSHAQITLSGLFNNNMVLQRNIEIPIWGMASPQSTVITELDTVRITTKADGTGKWIAYIPKFNAGGPYKLKVYEKSKPHVSIEFQGILIGDVWLASGQSNMEWQVKDAMDAHNEISHADFPEIRFFNVEHDKKLTPQSDISSGKWQVCDSINVEHFSAVAYYFARKMHKDQKVPIGIIQSTWGGTPVESWTSRDMLLTSSLTKLKVLDNDSLTPDDFVNDSLNLIRFWDIVYNPKNNADKILSKPEYDDSDWQEIEMPKVISDFGIGAYEGMIWFRKKITLPESFIAKDLIINLGHPEMNYSLYINGTEICKTIWNANSTHTYNIPADLIANRELTLSVRIAMLWGGGGFNPPSDSIYVSNGASKIVLAGTWLYKKDFEPVIPKICNYHYYPSFLFNAMINPLIPYGIKGFIWYQGEANDSVAYNYRTLFPMLINDWRQRWKQGNIPFIFVQLAYFKKVQVLPTESEWAELREAQTLTLSLPNTGMACIIDIGDANTIHPLNKQEVGRRLALIANKLTNEPKAIASGPVYKNYKINGNSIIIDFENTGLGLSTNDGKDVTGFAIAGNDKQFYWANAYIEGNNIVVHSDKVIEPEAVRYAWADNPVCNLINSEGLPAMPFRTDAWKGITQKENE
jgi:sialate O-acetylesterase